MTTGDNEPTARDLIQTPPPPRRKATPKRTPPRRGQAVAGGSGDATEPNLSDVLAAVNAVATNVGELSRRVEQVESGGIRYVETEAEPKADARAVNPEALDPFTRKLWEERTSDTPDNYGGDQEPAYNIPPKTYLKNDGTYVQLQGDSKSRMYYSTKGFYCLNDSELAEYEKLRPGIVAEQREKAHLITAIRRLIDTDAALVGHKGDNDADAELDLNSIEQLHQTWRSLCAETSQPERVLPAMKRWRSEGRDHQLDGVDMSPPGSRRREFEAEQQGGETRSSEWTAS